MTRLSIASGEELDPHQQPNLAKALAHSVKILPEGRLVFIDADGATSVAAYAQIWERSRRILGGLRRIGVRPGDKLILYFHRSEDFVPALWASFLAGAIPVPLARLEANRRHAQVVPELFDHLLRVLSEPPVISDVIERYGAIPGLERERVFSLARLETEPPADEFSPAAIDSPALFVISSGTTGRPNLVVLSAHAVLSRWWPKIPEQKPDSCFLYWSPFDHVMGMGMAIPSLDTKIHMAAELFVKSPGAWLDTIEQYRVTHSTITNFGMALVERHVASSASRWDLSSIRKIGVGAEAISPNQCRRFAEILQPCGLRSDAIILGYGLSECGPVVGGGHPFSAANANVDDLFAILDKPTPGHAVRVVDDRDHVIPEGCTGAVQVKGPTMAAGYFGDDTASAGLFTTDGWLRTGDFGSLHDGMLKVTGREKETIIVNAKKYACAEIEALAQSIAGAEAAYAVPLNCSSSDRSKGDDSRFAVFLVAPALAPFGLAAERVRSAIASRFGFAPACVIPIAADAIPRTRSGKVQRLALAEQLERGAFEDVLANLGTRVRSLASAAASEASSETERMIASIWAGILGFSDFGVDVDFFELGADSLAVLRLIVELEAVFDRQFPVDIFHEATTIARLAAFLDRDSAALAESGRARPHAGRRVGAAAPVQRAYGLLGRGRKSVLKYAVRRLRAYPDLKYVATLVAWLDAILAPRLTARELADELEWARAAKATPTLDRISPFMWANACHELLETGRMAVLEYAVRHLHPSYPDLKYLAALAAWLDAIPRHLPAPLVFSDDPETEIQVVRRPACDSVLFCFCAARGTLGLPINLVHEWLGRLPVSLVYIKDVRDLFGGLGYPTIGADREASVAALRRLAKSLGGRKIYAFGVSLGGYPALYYGLQLGARGVLSLAGSTDLTRGFVERWPLSATYLNFIQKAPDHALNLRALYQSATRRPRGLFVYGSKNAYDRQQAERMRGLPGVDLIEVENYAHHNVIDALIQRRQFLDILYRLLSLEEIDEADAPALPAKGSSEIRDL